MKKEIQQLERKGLPGGPNEMFTYTTGVFSTEGFRMDSPDINNYQNIIPSGSISMKERDGSPLRKGPIHGVDNLGNEQVMYPGFDYQFPGTEVTETLMAKMGGALLDKTIKCGNCGWEWKAADGGSDVMDCHKCGGKGLVKAQTGTETKGSKNRTINLTDFTMTAEDLAYVNDRSSGYCPSGNCLENTKKAYDMTAGKITGIPNNNAIATNDLKLISTASKPSEELIKKYPYFAGDNLSGSADSWDIHGVIVGAGGKNIYSQAKGQAIPKDIPIGSFVGWGPASTKESNNSSRSQGLNTKYGLQPSHHSTQVVAYNEKGDSIVYDSYLRKYGTLSEIGDSLKNAIGYELENISVPKSVSANTRDNLSKKGLLLNEITPYIVDINKLISGAKQPWAQIKEDGKTRAPNIDKEKLSLFAKTLSDNKGQLISSLGLSNERYNELANQAMVIAMTESEGGGALGITDRFGSTQGMTQLNVDNIKNDQRLKNALDKKYNGIDPTDLRNPAGSAIATLMYLSVASKDAERLYNKGLKPGVKTFNQPGFIENFRSTNSRLNKDGVFIDELNKRILYSQIPGYDEEDTNKINKYLKTLTKSDKYIFVDNDGELSLNMKTKGNNTKLTDIQKIGYMWQSPNTLKTGDAEGKSEYVNKINNYYNLISSKELGGQLNSGNITMYRDYIKGNIENEIEAIKNYDKLNRIYYSKAKELGMSTPNYIMTHVVGNS